LWLMTEIVSTDDRQSLEGQGLMRVELSREPGWRIPPAITALGLSDQEAWDLLAELTRSLRQQGAITMPDEVDPRDEQFDPRRGPIYVRDREAEPKRKVLSWLPTRGVNRRLDYVTRLLKALGNPADPRAVLDGCWRTLKGLPDGWLTLISDGRLGSVYQVDHTWLRLSPVGPGDLMYRCQQCRRLASVSLRCVCTTMGCAGVLIEYAVPKASEDDGHYQHLYRSLNPVPLSAREHTGQLTSMEAADIQQRFVRGEINALLDIPNERIYVIPPATDPRFRPADLAAQAGAREKYGLGERFILHVGGLDARQNLEFLIGAFAAVYNEIGDPDLSLFIAGDPQRLGSSALYPDWRPLAATFGIADRIQCAWIVEADMPAVYSACSCFVFPSLYEGFGLTPLEAMACGAPVVCSNVGAIFEAVGIAGLQVDPTDVDRMSAAIVRVLTSRELANDYRQRGLAHVRRFAWDRVAAETSALYAEVTGTKRE